MADTEVPLTSFPMEVLADFNIDAADIAAKLTRTQIVQFIKELDDSAGSWIVTLILAEYFGAEAKRAREDGIVGPTTANLDLDGLVSLLKERDDIDASQPEVA